MSASGDEGDGHQVRGDREAGCREDPEDGDHQWDADVERRPNAATAVPGAGQLSGTQDQQDRGHEEHSADRGDLVPNVFLVWPGKSANPLMTTTPTNPDKEPRAMPRCGALRAMARAWIDMATTMSPVSAAAAPPSIT